MRHILSILAIAATIALSSPPLAANHHEAAPSSAIAAAVSAPGRPAEAVALDESRKPAHVLSFLGLKPGMKTADLMTGTGYWAEIMARATGPKGSVTAFEPEQFYNDDNGNALWKALLTREKTITLTRYPFEAFAPAEGDFDFALINLSYHDLYWVSEKYKISRTDPDAYLKSLYGAMKPGGIVGVIDHVGTPGDTRTTVDKLHRIDPEVVKADFKRAGFILEAESELLRNPADDHDKLVFDPAIRGKTDRFLFRFIRPGGHAHH